MPKVQQRLELPQGSPLRESILRQRASCLILGQLLEESQQIVVALLTFLKSPVGLESGHCLGENGKEVEKGNRRKRRKGNENYLKNDGIEMWILPPL